VNLDAERALLLELAASSGEFIRPFFGRSDLRVDTKADKSPVTEADTGAEELMRRRIAARFPSHGIVGEEHGADRPDAEFVWVLDPIDGTKSFAAGVPLFGTLIALVRAGEPVLGCIHQPVLGQLVVGDNHTTTLNGRAVRTRRALPVEEATLLTSDAAVDVSRPDCTAYQSLMRRARVARTWGDCYGHMLVAAGMADVMFDPIMNPWDIAALVPVVRGAGGVITDASGGRPYPAKSTLTASGPELHRRILGEISRA
jgi:myo-inositol-1(or 4)-monophosphatase